MKTLLTALLAAIPLVSGLCSTDNLVPNGDFSAANPLAGWRVDFPYEPWYTQNVKYVKVSETPGPDGLHAVEIDLPPGVAGNQGGKIESAFFKAEPGATYRVQIDCMTKDFSAKLFVEAWALDPKPAAKPDKFRVPARNGLPALVMCYRAQIPDPPSKSSAWTTVTRDFTIPLTVTIGGQEEASVYLSMKAVVYEGTQAAGESLFANFRLTKIQSNGPDGNTGS